MVMSAFVNTLLAELDLPNMVTVHLQRHAMDYDVSTFLCLLLPLMVWSRGLQPRRGAKEAPGERHESRMWLRSRGLLTLGLFKV